jgi:hypothetical protein
MSRTLTLGLSHMMLLGAHTGLWLQFLRSLLQQELLERKINHPRRLCNLMMIAAAMAL